MARALLVPETFGQYGHYRGAAPLDLEALQPRHLGEQACAECHDEQVSLHDKDAHATVPCEDCHGPGYRHAADPEHEAMRIPEGKAPCLACHRLLDARPGWFAQIDPVAHFQKVGVGDPATECTACHDPHEPLYMDRDLRTARLHPLIHRCRDCHIGRRDRGQVRPADHPAIFQCDYCHARIAADFQTRPHHELGCTTCHIFFVESGFAGRILRDADPRFCLLCHREAGFRSDDAPPGIEWPGHLEDVAEEPADKTKRCIDCHQDRIHLGRARPDAEQGEDAHE